jgi:DNA-binding transcriptional ArsR family regulator
VDFVYLQRECGLTQGNLSRHLSKLEEAGRIFLEGLGDDQTASPERAALPSRAIPTKCASSPILHRTVILSGVLTTNCK